MHVGLDVRILGLRGPRTGIPSYVYHMAMGLRSLHEREVTFYADRPVEGVAAKVVPKIPGLPWLQTSLVAAAYRGKISIFHGPAYALPRFAPFKRVVTIHDFGFLRFPQWVDPDVRQYLSSMVPKSIQVADGIIVPTQEIEDEMYEFFPESRKKPVWVVPMGSVFGDNGPKPLPYSPTGDTPYILHVGTLEPRKNIATLIQAFELLIRNYRIEHKLVLVGAKGWQDEKIRRAIDSFPFAGHLILAGYVSLEELATWYAHASLYVQPSWYEGFGMATLDAYIWGLPIVASPTGWVTTLSEESYPVQFVKDVSRPELLADALRHGLVRMTGGKALLASRNDHSWLDISKRQWYLYEVIEHL